MMGQSLLVRDEEGNYRPAHKSLLEFFVAFKFAAELGLLHPNFLALVREPGEEDLPVGVERQRWRDYWGYARQVKGQRQEMMGFAQEDPARLVTTFGLAPLNAAVLDLLLWMLDVVVDYRKTNQLLELMQWTRGRELSAVGYVGSNAGTALVRLNAYGLEYQDLQRAVLPNINLIGAGLRDADLRGAVLTDALMTQAFAMCSAIAIDEERQLFFTGHSDGVVKIWSIDGQELFTCHGHKDWVNSVAVSGEWLFSASNDKTLKQWDIATGRCLRTFTGHNSSVSSVAVSGEWLFSASDDETVKQWDIATGLCLCTFTGHDNLVNSVAVSGEWLFSGSDDETVKQWEIATGRCQCTFTGHNSSVNSVAVSGEWLFSGSYDMTVKQWEIATGLCQRTFTGHKDWVRSVVVSGEWLFSGSNDKIVKQWDVATGLCLRTFTGHNSSVNSVAVSGEWLFSGSYDNTVKQWEIATGRCLRTFTGHDNLVISVAVSGEWLFSGSYDMTVKQWEIATGKCIATFDHRLCAGAKLSAAQGLTPAQTQSLATLGAITE
jgi:WD40 repeat protein